MSPRRPAAVRAAVHAVALLLLALLPAVHPALAGTAPLEAFARHGMLRSLALSPDGGKLAALVENGRSGTIVVLSVPGLQRLGGVTLDGDRQFVDFQWASDERIVTELGFREGPLAAIQSTGELAVIDGNGSNLRYLLGQSGSDIRLGSRLGRRTHGEVFAHVVDPLIDQPNHVIVATESIGAGEHARAVLAKLDLRNSRLDELAVAPIAGAAHFVVDRQGRPRFVAVQVDAFIVRTWRRDEDGKDWIAIEAPGSNARAVPLALSEDGQAVFLESREFGPRSCLVRQPLAGGSAEKLACHDQVDLDGVITGFAHGGEPIAAVFEADRPQIVPLATGHRDLELLAMLREAFAGKALAIASQTRDGHRVLVFVKDDRTPGDYYLFDTRTRAADYLVAVGDWLDPDWMGERRPIRVAARDGAALHGWLTIPPGSDGRKLPLVVMPHGGPFGTRDGWAFDADAQMLATQGYGVLQVNFRGSDGYGALFEQQGRRAWGTRMIDDLSDAARWAVKQGHAEEGRLCIAGASYGGYAALMSAVREPALYRCVIAEAGVYDLKLWKRDVDFIDTERGKRYFDTGVAANDEEMQAQSPLTYIDQLVAPVLIIHGENDRRTPLTQAKALRKALDAKEHPYQWLVRPGEGHGFYREENLQARNRAMVDFLGKHLGPPASPSAD
ncbi:MAG: prolyl oligopeptidase family serine peptidase [Gammaproteobacteria bacterium]|nr:prolyl oligopeptidase family serine peptidase [Gammaproteobacteria bacterium]